MNTGSMREGITGVVNELLVQMQSFDVPVGPVRLVGKLVDLVNRWLPADRLLRRPQMGAANVLVIAATNRAADLDPAFGVGSLAEHRRRGAAVLELDLPRLRRDVDTAAELRTALAWGCGPRTTAVAALWLGQRLP